MNKLLLIVSLLTFASSTMIAQDDMYFTPRKKSEAEKAAEKRAEAEKKARIEAFRRNHVIGGTYYAGVNRDLDEYNRRGKYSSTQAYVNTDVDSLGNDVIDFTPGTGEYPDSVLAFANDSIAIANAYVRNTRVDNQDYDYGYDDEDYRYSRMMNRFGNTWRPYYGYYDPWYYDPWFAMYDPYYWRSPYYGGYYGYYDPWYDPWYSPYHYGFYGGYYGGYYGYNYWTRPIIVHNGGGHYHTPGSVHGTQNHGRLRPHGSLASTGGSRNASSRNASSMSRGVSSRDRSNANVERQAQRMSTSGNFSGYRGNASSTSGNFSGSRGTVNSTNASSSRSTSTFSAPTRTTTTSSSHSSSSFSGGSRSGGSFGGGGGSRGGGIGIGGRR